MPDFNTLHIFQLAYCVKFNINCMDLKSNFKSGK